jgi:hypothetical protein
VTVVADSIFELLTRLQDEVTAHLADDDPAFMHRFGRLTAARAERLDATRRRLEAELGPDHPRVVALGARHAHLADVAREVGDVAQRRADARRPRPQEWQVLGRIVDDRGVAVPDLHVRFVDREGVLDLPNDAVTDQRGEFATTYHIKDFGDPGESPPEVTIIVTTAKGRVLLTSDESLHPAAGHSDVVEIVLARDRLAQDAPRERCAATTAKGDRCRNFAEPGARFCHLHRKET